MLQATDVWFRHGHGRGSSRIVRHGSARISTDQIRTDPDGFVLQGLTFDVPADGFLGILGPNGAGKTTLLRLLAGTLQPQQGVVALDDVPLSRYSRAALARRIAVVPQETHLAFDYTVEEVAMMGRYPHLGAFEIEGPTDIAVVEHSLASTGTLHLKDRLFATLSGGEKQRVIIASALAQLHAGHPSHASHPTHAAHLSHPRFLLLDEPTASLDLGYQIEVASLLRRLHEERGVAIVISTHDLGLAATLCDRALLIRDGALVASGTIDVVLTPENVREVYGVDVEVVRHPSRRWVIVPIRRADQREQP